MSSSLSNSRKRIPARVFGVPATQKEVLKSSEKRGRPDIDKILDYSVKKEQREYNDRDHTQDQQILPVY